MQYDTSLHPERHTVHDYITVADPRGGGQGGPDPPPPLSGKYNVFVNCIRICLARYTM